MDQHHVRKRLLEMGATLAVSTKLVRMEAGGITVSCTFTNRQETHMGTG